MIASAIPLRGRRHWLVLSVLAVALVIPVAVSTPVNAQTGQCTVVETAGQAELTFDTGNDRSINVRRDGGWLGTLPAGSTSYTDNNAPGAATYTVRTRPGGTVTDITCTTNDGTPPEPEPPTPEPPTVGTGECTVVETAGQAELTFNTGNPASINLRRNGAWLASLSGGSTTYTDNNAPGAATYTVRTRPGGTVTDITCTTNDGTPPEPEPQGERVIHISVDGLRSDYVTDEITPNIAALIDDGASTLNARTDPDETRTLPNHTSQFTGRFVGGAGGHQTTFNNDPGNTIDDLVGFEIPSVFDVVDAAGGQTILYAGKEKFDYINRSFDDSIDIYVRDNPFNAVDAFIADVVASEDQIAYAFYHIRTPDEFGHVAGWGTAEYQAAVSQSDEIIGEIVDELGANGLLSTTTIIVTSDHGGADNALFHDSPDNPETYTIPFVVVGPGVQAGADLYELNSAGGMIADPGAAQVGRDGIQPVRGHDAANLGLDLLGLPALPAPATNSGHDLEVS